MNTRQLHQTELSGHFATPRVVVKNLTKIYRTRRGEHRALDNVSLEIGSGEFVVLLGPSGCGKTTLLRCVAGLETPDAGEISIDGRVVFSSEKRINLPPERRGLGMVFQSYALWPHLTVFENVAYPLREGGTPRGDISIRVKEALERVALETYADAYPGHLSGGQQQRVALARAMVAAHGLVLFDEPLSNLDAKVRERLRLELIALQRSVGFSSLYVTHDQSEALALADRIAVMAIGRISQVDAPQTIYTQPASRYVANFVGKTNEVSGRIVAIDGKACSAETPLGVLSGITGPGVIEVGQAVRILVSSRGLQFLAGRQQHKGAGRTHALPRSRGRAHPARR